MLHSIPHSVESLLAVLMQRFNATGCQKKVSETNGYVTTTNKRPTYLAMLLQVHNRNFSFPLYI